jgi:asparagine synthase (glutamine-hydrolysing)
VAAVAIASNRQMVGYHADVLADSERDAAEDVARTLGLALRTTEVSDERFLEAVPAATWANDVPLTYHLNSVPFFLVCRLARADGVKVLLTGEGSDEYFLGYPQLALEPVMERVRSARTALNLASHRTVPRLAALLWPRQAQRFSDRLGDLVTGYEADLVATTSEAAADHLADRRERRTLRLTLGLIDQHLVSLLHRNDRLGMAASLESRFPFLGHELARLAINLPATYKLHGSRQVHDRRHPFVTDKWVIRELAKEVVPSRLAGRAKQGFPVSVYDRLELTTATFADGWVADAFSLDTRALRRLVDAGPSVWTTRLMLLDVWARLFVTGSSIEDCQAHLCSTTTLRP